MSSFLLEEKYKRLNGSEEVLEKALFCLIRLEHLIALEAKGALVATLGGGLAWTPLLLVEEEV